ncbi:major capsid protein [Neoaquamicrobium sediminum]|uniref:major capsid protein n=1 Tax=Neoaquamicrobium sediminum TaxID=1849104 RepID=UPI0015637933|nr:major capsid protein [Mesorhizobium sediminum]NRC54120.1 major capsid protein [Mesorhizobium sediminum]
MANPYEVWNTRRSLGVMRDVEPAFTYWTDIGFSRSLTSTDEWVDFEKLPAVARKLAPFVRPLGSGKPLYDDRSTGFRFKPAYVKPKDVIDPLMPLTKRAGIDRSMIEPSQITPMQRRDLIRTAMTITHVQAIERRWEWMAARAIIDAKVTIEGEEYPSVELDFRRQGNLTVVKTVDYWGDTGVSIFSDIQTWADRMFNAPFGGFPTRMTVGSKVWAVMRMDKEFMEHMDTNIRNPRATIERGLIGADKVVKVGELAVGGASGAVIEIFLYRDTYVDEAGIETPFMASTDIVMTASDERIMGYQCFGAIIDPSAQYQPVPIYPRNWQEIGDPIVEYIMHQSAPLFVPLNANATFKATVVPE